MSYPERDFDPAEHGWTLRMAARFPANLGPVWERIGPDGPAVGLFCSPEHENSSGVMHGGMISTLADMGLGFMVRHQRGAEGRSVTVQLNVSFSGAVPMGAFVYSRAEVSRATRSMTFISGELIVGDQTVAMMQGVFKLLKPAAPTG
ncbi:PaaI family thioesterase [Pseudoroseicyclus sp. H15]